MRLSPHFTLEELTVSQEAARRGLDNTPDAPTIENLRRLAIVLEEVRLLLGNHAILVSSGYRGSEVNAAVGGSKTSAHMRGLAADFTCPGFGTPRAVCEAIAASSINFHQVICEFDSWCHLGLSEGDGEMRRQVLTINRSGTHVGIV